MLYPLVLVIHIIVCFILIAVILLQAGRGGGLSDAFSGTAQSVFGTRGAAYLTRATTACAVIFMVTSLGLALLSAQKGHSLMEKARVAPVPAAASTPATPVEEADDHAEHDHVETVVAPAVEAPAEALVPGETPAPAAEQPASESKPSE